MFHRRAFEQCTSGVPPFVKELVGWGAGPRACQQWILGGKVRAILKGRFHVTLDDVMALALPVLRHRIVANFAAASNIFCCTRVRDAHGSKSSSGHGSNMI